MTALQSLASWWWGWVVPAALQATPLLLLAAFLDLQMPRLVAPRWRSWLWFITAAKLFVPFSGTATLGLLPRPFLPETLPGAALPLWVVLVPAIWLVVAIALAAGSALWLRREVTRWRADSVSSHDPLVDLVHATASALSVTPPRIVTSRALVAPFVTGIARPTLYWPESLSAKLSPEEVTQVIRHELTHLKRFDTLRDLAWSSLLLVFWFHPLVWWASRRQRALREQCCDWTASRLPGHDAPRYQTALLRVALDVTDGAVPAALALVDPREPLAHRIALIDASASRRGAAPWRIAGALVSLTVLMGTWPLAAWAQREAVTVTEWIARPPGSLQLQFIVLERLRRETHVTQENHK